MQTQLPPELAAILERAAAVEQRGAWWTWDQVGASPAQLMRLVVSRHLDARRGATRGLQYRLSKAQEQHLNRNFIPSPQVRVIVAAADSPQEWKQIADYLCDGLNDEVEIEAAIRSLGLPIELAPGSYLGQRYQMQRTLTGGS